MIVGDGCKEENVIVIVIIIIIIMNIFIIITLTILIQIGLVWSMLLVDVINNNIWDMCHIDILLLGLRWDEMMWVVLMNVVVLLDVMIVIVMTVLMIILLHRFLNMAKCCKQHCKLEWG